jgi:hypothetical protein
VSERRSQDRRNGDSGLETHRKDAYAHYPLVARMQNEGKPFRDDTEKRLSALEAFKAQTILVGSIVMIVLGAVSYAVFSKLIH